MAKMMFSLEPVMLTEDFFISRGNHRAVYRYPGQPDKCIKVIIHDRRTCLLEIEYLGLLHKKGIYPTYLPRYYGMVPTNLGIDATGYVYDVVENADGSRAFSLEDFLGDEALFKAHEEEIFTLMERLRADLYKDGIVCRAIEEVNILFPKKLGRYDIRLVNDLGSHAAIKLDYYFKWAARKHIDKIWKQLKESYIPRHHAHQPWALEFAGKI